MATARARGGRLNDDSRRLVPALPFAVLASPDTVRLVAGEDARYTLTGAGIESWLPKLLGALDGRATLEEAIGLLPEEFHAAARGLAGRLCGERLLVEGTARDAHRPGAFVAAPRGCEPLVERIREVSTRRGQPLAVLCQDRLDYAAALGFNRTQRAATAASPWLWVTTGPMGRGYVSPVFWPDAGPCLACLLARFRRLSPEPELYEELTEHARAGGEIPSVPFPERGVEILAALARWKIERMAEPVPPAAVYRLHVLEAATLEVTTHRVFAEPDCPECGDDV